MERKGKNVPEKKVYKGSAKKKQGTSFPVMKVNLNGTLATVPCTEEGVEFLKKMKYGEPYENELWQPRNYKNLQRYRVMLKYIAERSQRFPNPQKVDYELKIRIGEYDEHWTSKGVLIPVPRSYSFGKMDEGKFREIFSKSIDAALKYMVNDAKKEDRDNLENIVLSFA